MTKRLFLVTGVENSGNRMLRNCLLSSGCFGDTIQDFDSLSFDRLPPRVAMVRSIPHGDHVPDLKEVARAAQLAGYEVVPIHVYRKTEFSIAGQERVYNRDREAAIYYRSLATRLAYELSAWLGVILIVVPYEPFVIDPAVRIALFATLGFPAPTVECFNANEKYQIDSPPLPF